MKARGQLHVPAALFLAEELLARFNPLNAQLNPIWHLLILLGAHHILHISRMRVKYYAVRDPDPV
jgi:hypothetical protein